MLYARGAVTPVSCPLAAQCAGCPLIDQPLDQQLSAKRARVTRATARFASLAAVEVAPTRAPDPAVGYRTRAKLVVAPGARVGLYAREGDHVVVDIPDCRVLSPALAEGAAAVRALLRDPPPVAAPALAAGALLAVDLREAWPGGGPPRVLATLVVDDSRHRPVDATLSACAIALHERAPLIASVAVSFRARRSPQILGSGLRVLFGPEAIGDRLSDDRGSWVNAVHGGFVQVHRRQGADLRARVADGLDAALGGLQGRVIVDAYAGSGATGLVLASLGARVVLIESHAASAAHAERAAAAQALPVEVLAADAAAVLADFVRARRRVDAVVLNPPRRGVAPAVRIACAALAPRAIAIVSCEPDTLARDLDHFARLGFGTAAISPLDMIPQTDEVESVAILGSRAPAPLVVLYEDAEVVAVDKPAHLPTTPQGEHADSLLARVRALPGLADAVPVHRLDAGTSGACLFARTPGHVAPWAAALAHAEADKEYVALVRGVTRDKGSVSTPLRDGGSGRAARTRFRRLRAPGGHSLLAVRIEHGRTHQIRRHLASIGHPVLGDARHGHAPSNRHFFERHGLDRPFLHCARLTLPHPRTGHSLTVQAPLPGELATVLARLEE